VYKAVDNLVYKCLKLCDLYRLVYTNLGF
jgi:hypothetical protein